MSYEIYRTEIAERLKVYLSDQLLQSVLTDLDEISTAYTVERKPTALALVDEIPEAMKLYLASKAARRLKKGTLNNYYLTLKNFFKIIRKPVTAINANDIRVYLFQYGNDRKVKGSTLRGIQNQLGDFFAWCADEEIIPKDPARRVEPVKMQDCKLKPMTLVELETVRFACKSLYEKALVDFMYSTGCRVAECCDMRLSDIDMQERSALVRNGKGSKSRTVYINAEALISLKAYLKTRSDDCDYLFVNRNGKEKHCVSTRSLQRTIKEITARVILPTHVTPHTFRRTAATVALRNGMPIEQVQRMLGHTKLDTTIRYTTIDDTEVRYNHERSVI